MFDKVLIANRGEIAVRVARACRELGVKTVAVYSTADARSAVVAMADEAVCIGPPPPARSYLHVPSIIGAAQKTGADAIHPGYGFLSEDPFFAEICADHGFVFIGPPADVMEELGNKASARRLMKNAGLPLADGTLDPVASVDEAAEIADDIGYPVIIKAAAGGGGRGMAVVHRPADFAAAYEATRATAQAVFRDSTVYVERYLESARHIEVQVVCDGEGNAVHLGERDCSVQRRHQKLVEESPSPAVDEELRKAMGEAAVAGARAAGYYGVGTMEFLLDAAGSFTFMEMNTRIQVEHPVTELVTGIDLVQEQLRVAAGEPLSFTQDDVVLRGHALECRINAEDPGRHFAPTAGTLSAFDPPGGPWTRVDTHCFAGYDVPPFYDSLLAKVIVWAPDRWAGIERMRRALTEFRVEGRGVSTTIAFHLRVLDHPVFRAGEHTTDFLTRHDVFSEAAHVQR